MNNIDYRCGTCEECGDYLTEQDMELPCSRDLCNHCYLHTSDE